MDLPYLDLKLWALPAVLLLFVAWAAALVVYRTAPHRAVNRALARVLLLEGLVMGFSAGWNQMAESASVSLLIAVIGTMAVAAAPYHYLIFLGAALDAPLVRPFRGRRARQLLLALSVLAAGVVLVRPGWFISDLYAPDWATWNFQYRDAGLLLVRLQAFTALFAIGAAVWSWARTPRGSAARSRAVLVAAAFGIRDLYIAIILILYPYLRPVSFWGDFIYNPAQGLVYLVYVSLLAYGLLHSQLFDIELKVKFALTKSAAGALLAGVFFLVSEGIEALLPVEGAMPGLIAAGLVVLALRPLHGLARRLMDRVMPGVERSPEYLEARSFEVYRAALEGAMEDGRVTPAEHAILARLRDQLGLEEVEAGRLEQAVLGRLLARV